MKYFEEAEVRLQVFKWRCITFTHADYNLFRFTHKKIKFVICITMRVKCEYTTTCFLSVVHLCCSKNNATFRKLKLFLSSSEKLERKLLRWFPEREILNFWVASLPEVRNKPSCLNGVFFLENQRMDSVQKCSSQMFPMNVIYQCLLLLNNTHKPLMSC